MAGCVLLVALGGVAAAIAPAPGQKSSVQEMPGPLSPAHAGTPGPNCQACHDANFKAIPQKCLACHQEIGRQASAPKGYHRDKREGCADCHAEHQGEGKSLVPLDIKDFDHAETGTVLRGGHQKVVGCDSCHRPEVSFPRAKTKSYILKESGCRACHRPPHAGRQDDCLACHDQNSWTVDRVNGGK
jgi:hypothetical protein